MSFESQNVLMLARKHRFYGKDTSSWISAIDCSPQLLTPTPPRSVTSISVNLACPNKLQRKLNLLNFNSCSRAFIQSLNMSEADGQGPTGARGSECVSFPGRNCLSFSRSQASWSFESITTTPMATLLDWCGRSPLSRAKCNKAVAHSIKGRYTESQPRGCA
jgi:hypothetical protein